MNAASDEQAWGPPRTATISWHDPDLQLDAALELSGLDYIQAVRDGSVPPQPMASVIGLELTRVQRGEVEMEFRPVEYTLNAVNSVHGGVVAVILDTVMGLACRTYCEPGQLGVTAEMHVSFLRPIPAGERPLRFVGRVLKPGRNLTFTEGHGYAPDGKLVAHGTMSLAIVASGRGRS